MAVEKHGHVVLAGGVCAVVAIDFRRARFQRRDGPSGMNYTVLYTTPSQPPQAHNGRPRRQWRLNLPMWYARQTYPPRLSSGPADRRRSADTQPNTCRHKPQD